MRDITLEDTFRHGFTTRAFATGIPTVLAGTPVLSVLEENNATPITAGVSISVDRASVVGLNEATIVATAANGYELGKSYSLYISTGTVGGVSVVGEVVENFTVGLSAAAVDLANATDGLSALKTLTDAITTAVITNATGADVASDVVAMKAETVLIVADTGELQTDWVDGGRLDLLVDAILLDTGTTLDDHLTDIKGTAFVKDTHSLIDIETFVDLIDDGTSGLAKIASDAAAILADTTGLNGDVMRGTDNASLASVVGALADAASADEVTSADTLMQYIKQLINILVGAPGIGTLKAAAAPASGVSLSEMIRAIYDDSNELQTDWVDAGRLDAILDIIAADVVNIDGAAMRGTDSAALASVLGALADATAAGDPTASDTVVAYVKQLINTLEGTVGIPVFKAEAAPANNVSLSEVIRAIAVDVTGLAGSAMRGTDSAALAAACTEARLSELDAGTGGKAANQIDLIKTEADKIALVDASTGVAGSVIEEIENRATPAQVNTEVVDVLKTDTITLPGQAAPPAAPTIEEAVAWLYKAFRNKKELTSALWSLYDDAGSTVHSKATVSDAAGTATKEEVISGP